LTQATATWDSVTGLAIPHGSVDDLVFEFNTTKTTPNPTMHVTGISIIEEKV
jgi:hypothetical protein